MSKFGSEFKYMKYIGIILLLFGIILLMTVEDFDLVGFLIATLILALIVIIELFYSYNGLILSESKLIVCNSFIKQKFYIMINEIEKIELGAVVRNSYIIIFAKNYEQKKFHLRGFSLYDLEKWISKFQELEIDTELIDKR